MITMKMQGGLGNQMFEFATGYAIAKKLGVELALDISSYAHDPLRRFNLDLFRIDNKIVFDSKTNVIETRLYYDPGLSSAVRDGDVLSGYFQDERYFSEYYEELAKLFQPREFPLPFGYEGYLNKIVRGNSVALAIRRTDYLAKQDYHGVLTDDYYRHALDYMVNSMPLSVSPPLNLFIFSDDIEWCKRNINYPCPTTFIENDMTTSSHLGREDADIFLMKHCRAHILANSTFSWWGAYLSGSNRVVAPRNWYADKSIEHSIIPKRWQQL